MSYYFENIQNISEADNLKILNMRNHPDVAKQMETPKFITWREHLEYISNTQKNVKVFYCNNTPVGTFELNLESSEFGIMIDPYYKGAGFGTAMMKLFLEEFPNHDLKSKAKKDNTVAVKLYEKFDFKFTDIDSEYFGIKRKGE